LGGRGEDFLKKKRDHLTVESHWYRRPALSRRGEKSDEELVSLARQLKAKRQIPLEHASEKTALKKLRKESVPLLRDVKKSCLTNLARPARGGGYKVEKRPSLKVSPRRKETVTQTAHGPK